ncbi:MAG: transcription-repair coupling factor [Paludibacteraceae bacterium]|nr:transcription-repair coupling factor [Paludibacteraceae bacterium]
MELGELYDVLTRHPAIGVLSEQIKGKCRESHFLLSGLYASARAIVLRKIVADLPFSMLIVADNQDEAQYLYADLKSVNESLPKDIPTLYFPSSHRRRQGTDEAMEIQRTEVLSHLSADSSSCIVVTYPEAIAESVPCKHQLQASTFVIQTGQEIHVSTLSEQLTEQGFERVDFVYEPGQFAIRGGIVDIFSYSHEDPYRLDFFGDEVDSIRTFDIETQLSSEKVDKISVVASNDSSTTEQDSAYITDYIACNTLWVSNDWNMVHFKLEGLLKPDIHTSIEIRDKSFYPNFSEIHFDTLPQPLFHKNFELLTQDIKKKEAEGYHIYILADQKKQTDRLAAIFDSISGDDSHKSYFTPVDKTLHSGWVDREAKVACYTDHELFERFHRVTLKSENARRGKAIITLKEINQLQPGDYVVHSDHGIGQFGGLVTTSVNGRAQEMIKLLFRDGDTIFVSIHNLHRISKYKGKEGSVPTISKLGSGAWERLKERTKDRVKDIARDLIKLYATRKGQKGFAYTPDGYMQHELEASFIYEDTPDQAKATLDVKRDMESPMPMDRLICGDVGFGKTEIAMRAAFKAATDGKQVAVLVPTTVLALQHYNSFKERFRDFPVNIEYLSRAKSDKQAKEIIQQLKDGKIDILIGTHKIVGKSVTWHDLGLLIIDEEQKFGVAVKDKLKELRANIDVLTLTATPIPRTLQFSLLGARDLSVMTTPPQNRYPIQTEQITPEDEDIIKEAIDIEMQRNGQVFIVNNRIDMLERIEHRIQRLCPEARIITAHGQMKSEEMEERLEAFINYDYDVLISTTIIESGVDIPNVNTIIIYSAQHYGLADLHQLRGRVGRSNRKAYCYLVAPERELLTEDARRRLDALSTFADLGSGFHLAMQDLDIRGAGNLLGAEQSGFIADLGYETYQRILNEAVQELKEEMLLPDKSVEAEESGNFDTTTIPSGEHLWCADSQLETDIPVSFPSTYIENISERITLYRELDTQRNENELAEYKKRLIDRFGPLPDEAEELMNVVRLRWLCCKMGIEKIFLKREQMTIYFTMRSPNYWHSDIFNQIMNFALSRLNRCRLVEEKDKKTQKVSKRYITIQQVRTIAGAMNILSKIERGDIQNG